MLASSCPFRNVESGLVPIRESFSGNTTASGKIAPSPNSPPEACPCTSLCVAVLLLPTLALAQARKTATPFTSPLIVAKAKLINQTAAIPKTTIFTPTQTGLYRISVYATVSVSDPSSQSNWNYDLGWTDDAGQQNAFTLLWQYGQHLGQFSNDVSSGDGGVVRVFEAKADTPITYDLFQGGGPPDNSAYSLYYTLERLE